MKQTLKIGNLLEQEDLLLNLPFSNFSKTCHSTLETAAKIIQADRGLLLLLDQDRNLKIQAQYGYQNSTPPWDEVHEISSQLIDEELSLIGIGTGLDGPSPPKESTTYICMALRKQGGTKKPQKAEERRKYNISKRQIAEEEMGSTVGVFYLDRGERGIPFSPQEISALESYVNYATFQLLQAKVYEMATLDATTHFFSRSQLERILKTELEMAENFVYPLAILMVELENLDSLVQNEAQGMGQEALQEVSRVIRVALRNEDNVIRYSKSDFVILLPGSGEEGAEIVGRRLQEKLGNLKIGDKEFPFLVNLGIVVYPIHGEALEKLIHRTVRALSLARHQEGRLITWSTHSEKMTDIITGDLARDYGNVRMLLDTIVAVNSTLDYDQLRFTILDTMINMTQGERAILEVYDAKGKRVETLAQNLEGEKIDVDDYPREAIEWVKEHNLPLITPIQKGRHHQLAEKIKQSGCKTVVCLPLSVRNQLAGILYVDHHKEVRQFTEQEKVFFQALSREMGIAMENAILYRENLKAKKKVEELNQQLQAKVEQQASELEQVKDTLDANLKELEKKYQYSSIVGKSKELQDLFELLDKISETTVPVLITGESGTGKELVSKAIHYNSPRKENRFVSINCAALSDSLLESELFGYVKGAFTGADGNKKGLVELADEGTLFLDEVGDMSMNMQKKLLRVLQEREFRPVGGKETKKINPRFLFATNRNLQELIERGEFRQDLYYRINVVHIGLPPLRERKEDIPLLFRNFLVEFSQEHQITKKKISSEAMKLLMEYDWPGNIRELKNFAEKMTIVSPGSTIEVDDVEPDLKGRKEEMNREYSMLSESKEILVSEVMKKMGGETLKVQIKEAFREVLPEVQRESKALAQEEFLQLPFQEAKHQFIKVYLQEMLEKNQHNVTQAAEEAGVLRSYFHKLIKKFDVKNGG